NIVTVTACGTTEYVVIKGNQVTFSVTNATSPDEAIKQGDIVNISFNGLHMPLPKFSGIYNPGFTNTIKASYSTENGGKVQSSGTQYDFISNHTISMTVYDHGTVKLTKGTIPLTSMGFVPGSHRELTDMGVSANFNASAVPAEFSRLPDISFTVLKNEDLSYLHEARENYSNLSKVEIMCGTSSYQKSFQFNLTTEAKASVKNNTATFSSINSEYPLLVTATPVNSDVTMEFRYWEAGDTVKHTVDLTPDETLSLENIFSGEKAIYMEIAVTPNNPIYGEGEVYFYVVYKTTAGFTKPILKALNVKDTEGNSFSAPYGVLRSENGLGISYTQTDYTCYIPEDAEAVTLSVARLNGSSDITLGSETQNIGIAETAFSVISVPNTETDVTITLADGAIYTVKLIKADGVLQKKIISDGEIVAVSFANTEDTNLDFYLASYVTENQMERLSGGRKELSAGDNTVYLSLSEFTDVSNLNLFVWDENLCPVFLKSKIETE
ncbi:MAG: hypothetical protein IJ367_02305, partial [Clostridia bacterium]|nr:hypothetical protein [Clostridia bacterium]